MVFQLLIYLFAHSLYAPSAEPTERWLVELTTSETECLDQWWTSQGLDQRSCLKKKLPVGNWMVIELPRRYTDAMKKLPCIVTAHPDLPIQWRDTEPNDPAFINQADMQLIGMPEAWDIARGGVTAQGDTIVAAIIDNGFQITHADLMDNIWRNKGEIPGDEIDNDDNGYIDDYEGINISTGEDVHPPLSHHGTSVAGIIGARGNNNTGIAGVNWRVKMMIISGVDFESEMIEAYEYVISMRKKYRITNGAQGAFVVVTNLSGGINNALAEDHPLWCEMYDKMGEEGILSVTAAPNSGISVDQEGDMPTTCTSPYMLAVTNVDLTDAIVGNAGFGVTSIDIGAPGHGTITTGGNNGYREFPGTSSAAPHVTGAIALMYSTPCATFLQNVKSDPEGVALRIKNIILSTGKPNNSLEGITLTGKRLQVDAAMHQTVSNCDATPEGGVSILSVYPNPSLINSSEVYFEVKGDTSTASFELYALNGSLIQSFPISSDQFAQGHIDINTDPLPAGIYLLSLQNKKEKATVKLFVIGN